MIVETWCMAGLHYAGNCPNYYHNSYQGAWENVNAMKFQGGQDWPCNDRFTFSYNEGWMDHSNWETDYNNMAGNQFNAPSTDFYPWSQTPLNSAYDNGSTVDHDRLIKILEDLLEENTRRSEDLCNAASDHPPGFPSKPQVPLNSTFNNASSSSNLNAFIDKYDKMFEMLTTNMTALSEQQQDWFNGQTELKKDNAELKKLVGDLVKQVSQVQEDPATSGKLEDGKTCSQPGHTSDQMDINLTSADSAHTFGIATTSADLIDIGIATKLSDPKAKNGEKGKLSNSLNSVLSNYLPSVPFSSRFDTSKKEASDNEIHEKEQTIGGVIEQVPKPTLELDGVKAKFNVSDKKPPPVPTEQVASVNEVDVANHEPPDRFLVGDLGYTNMHAKEASLPPMMIIGKSEWIDQMLEDLKPAGRKRKTCHEDLPGVVVEYHPFLEAGIT